MISDLNYINYKIVNLINMIMHLGIYHVFWISFKNEILIVYLINKIEKFPTRQNSEQHIA